MAVHIFGHNIRHNALVWLGLKNAIFGIGSKTAQRICAKVAIYPQMRMKDLTEPQIMDLNKEISALTVDGALKAQINENIKFKKDIGSYVGSRHVMGLPVRGQKTRNNAKTAGKLNKLERYKV
ncbi:small ribosomal subunit protein uS13m [Diutina catenulata]